jgi:hypothetical protein
VSTPPRHHTSGIQAPPLGDTVIRALTVNAVLVVVYLTAAPYWLVAVIVVAVFGGGALATAASALATLIGWNRGRD